MEEDIVDNLGGVFLDALLYAMEGESPSKAIENQERREQQTVVRNCRLPKKINCICIPSEFRDVDANDFLKQQYEKMGIRIIEDYDDLFYSVELPTGWEIKRTEHPMWNDVLDHKGRKRISFFYKGAFYDRDAFSNLLRRYSFTILPFDDYESDVSCEERMFKPWKLYLTDAEKKVKVLAEFLPKTREEYFKKDDKLRRIGEKYLNANYPEWKDISAYWD